MASDKPQHTDFSIDVMGRFVCNAFDEAMKAMDTSVRPDARPFDLVILGGGSFGGALAQHLLFRDKTHSHRILVLEGGPFFLPEHVQNLPMLGVAVPGPSVADPGPREQVWGLPWRTDVPDGFPGLAYCIGGRSLFFGGWSPELLEDETKTWPTATTGDLRPTYFGQAADQIGVSRTNDFIFGALHDALRKRLFKAINDGMISNAVPLSEIPQHLRDVKPANQELFKVEAPLAVQGHAPRPGFFAMNKFSSAPLLIEAARSAQNEANDDFKKRLMIVPSCHALRLITAQNGNDWKVVAVETSLGTVPLPEQARVIVALGTIESARLALTSFPSLPNKDRIGQSLMAHLRSNLTIRITRDSLPAGLPNELAASALFLKGRLKRTGLPNRYFHVQITAAGLDRPTTDTEPELFKKIPSVDMFTPFLTANDNQVVITLRGIGEMEPDNSSSHVTLSGDLDEFHYPRAFVSLAPNAHDQMVWDAMDAAADDLAQVFANGKPYEVLVGNAYKAVAADRPPSDVAPFTSRRDKIGTTHHECGTLRMGTDPTTSVTDPNGRFHFSSNTYVAGPALFPSIGSPNPMLTGVALARRLGDQLVPPPTPFAPDTGFTSLFDGFNTDNWRMSTIQNQPSNRNDPGRFITVDGALEAVPGSDLGLLWCSIAMPANYVLKLEWLRWHDRGNSGVFVRFPDPRSKGYDNTAYVGVNFGFEVQIDEFGEPDGAPKHKTGAIYNQEQQDFSLKPAKPAREWNSFEIRVDNQIYTVLLNGEQVTRFENHDLARGLPSTPGVPSYIGLQAHPGSRVAFRKIQYKALP